MKGCGFDEKHTIPRDSVAKKVVYDSGDLYDPKVKCNTYLYSTLPLPFHRFNSLPEKVRKDPNFKDFTSKRFGRFTVLGVFICGTYNKWVLRCSCGSYEIRTATALNKTQDQTDKTMCQSCLDTQRIKNKDFFKRNGYYPWQRKSEHH